MSALVSLDRALEQAESNPVSPPAHLMEKAIAVGVRKEKKASWLSRLLELPPAWRFGLATAAAAGVFLLTVLVTSPEPTPAGSPASELQIAVEKDTHPTQAMAERPVDQPPKQESAPVPDRETPPVETGRVILS